MDKRPLKEFKIFWKFLKPFLFGTAGATIVFDQISARDFGFSMIIIVTGSIIRYFSVLLVTINSNYRIKERILLASVWWGGGTLTATLGG
jgi:hypothetical protein